MNPASKVPAIAYGGPAVPADQPSPESVKIAESLVLVDFVADLFPKAKIFPSDPVQRAQARFFIEVVSSKFTTSWYSFVHRGGSSDDVIKAFEAIQSLLPATGFAVGEFSAADIAIAPFLARMDIVLRNELGSYEEGAGGRVLEILHSPQFVRLQRYFEDIKGRRSFQATFDEVSAIEISAEW